MRQSRDAGRSRGNARRLLPALILVLFAFTPLPVGAGVVYWDGGTADITTDGDGTSQGGAGTWDLTTLNWDAGAAPHVFWPNANDSVAVFGGTGDLVTINTGGTGLTANALTFNSTGYTIAGNVAADALTLAGPTPTVAVTNLADTAAISAIVAGSTGLKKDGSGTLVLSGTNTFTGNLTIKAGTVSGTISANAFGANTNVIVLGDSTGSANATLSGGLTGTFANPISVAGGNTGVATVTDTAASIFSGAVTLGSHDLTVGGNAGNALTLSGGITGTGNLTLSANGTGVITLSTAAVNNSGTITNSGSGTATNIISGGVGSNITAVNQSSTTSALTIQTTALAVNSAGTTLANTLGTKVLTVSGGVTGTGNLVLNNNSATASGITLSTTAVNNAGTITNSGSGTGSVLISAVVGANVTGVIQNSATSTLNFTTSANTYTSGLTIKAGTVTGSVAGSFGANSNVITIGDTTGSANATLSGAGAVTFANPISVAGGNTGVATITDTAASVFSGPVTLNSHDLSIGNGTTALTMSGPITGAGNLVLNGAGTGAITLSGFTVNNTGTITNAGAGSATNVISGSIGANVTRLVQSGAGTLQLTNSPNNYGEGFVNHFTGTTQITNGKVKLVAYGITPAALPQYAAFGLQKSVYDTTGSNGTTIGLDVNGATTPWLGALAGNVDLSGAIINYSTVTALTLNPQTGTSASYGGVIANGAGNVTLTKLGPGTQTLTGANTYSGATAIYAGTLALGGASGSALNSAFTVRGGTLVLDNSAGWTDRVADAAALSLGSLTLTSSNGAGIQSETVGATTFGTSGKITINNGATAGDQTTLALGAVTRSTGAAIDFAATGGTLGSGANSPNVTSSSLPANSNGILRWATVGGTQWAENNSNSVRAYSGTFVDPTTAASAATSNAQLTGTGTIDSAKSFNSLNVIASGAGQSLSLAGNLTLTSPGAILKSGSDAYTISGTGNITAGAELIAHVDGGDLTVSAPLNTAILNIAKGGAGKLILSGTRAATLSGSVSIAGTLEFQGATTTLSGVVSGPGGLIANLNSGQVLTLNNAGNIFTGPVLIKGGVFADGNGYNNQGLSMAPGCTVPMGAAGGLNNIEINGGILALPYKFSRYLGTGSDQIQITGGTSGFSHNGGASTNLLFNGSANYEIVWGSAYFQPTTLVLNDAVAANGTITIPNLLDLNGATRTVMSDNAANYATLSGVIRNSSGTAGITKTGLGELQLTAANTYNGGVTVSSGTLTVASLANGGSPSGLGTSSNSAANLLLGNGATLKYTGAGASTDRGFTINGAANGDSATLDASGSAALNFTNTASPAYGAANQTRTLTLTGSNTGNNILAANIADNGTGAVTISKTGAGLWVLSGASSYSGQTTLTAGTLSVGVSNNLGAPAANLVFNGGTLQITGTTLTSFSTLVHTVVLTPGQTVGLDIASAANTFTVDQVLNQGTGGLIKAGAGTLVLNQSHTYTGPTTISAGTLRLDQNAEGAFWNLPLLDNGTLIVNRSDTRTQGVNFPAILSGTGSLVNAGTGTLVLNAPTYHTGTTGASAGTIKLSHNLAIQNSALDTSGAGAVILDAGITTPTFGGLSGATDLGTGGALATGYSSVTALTLNPQSGVTFTYGGVISNGSGAMPLTKTGPGTQVLQGANTYTGATWLSAGALELSGAGSILNSAIAFSGGGLTLTNAAPETGAGRVNDSTAITSNGGTLTYNNTSGTNIYAETVGSVALSSGQFNIVLAVNQTGTGNQTLTLAGLTHTGASNASAVTFSALSTGPNATKNMIVVTGATATPTGQIVAPWATTGTAANAQTDYAIYNGAAQVVPAAIAASAETTWTAATNAYTLSGATTLTGSRTITALRYSGNAQTLALGANNLETYGLLNGGTGVLTVSGTGALRTPAGGGNLYLTAGNNAITVSAPITDGSDSAPVTLVKSGSGILTLSGTNSYSGGTVINGGRVIISSDANLGNASGGITVNGDADLQLSTNTTSSRSITLNNGAIFSTGGNTSFTTSGNVTGTGGVRTTNISFGSNWVLNGTNNTFEGPILIGINGSGNNSYTVSVASLADSAAADGRIVFASVGTHSTLASNFTYTGATNLVLNNRQIELAAANFSPGHKLFSNGTSSTITVNTDLVVSGTGSRMLTLAGSSTGTNVFAGKITDGAGAPVSITKGGAAVWTLSGNNSFTGGLTLSGATAGSQLNINSATALGTGTFTISGGNNARIDNTSGNPITLTTNNAQTWSNDFFFAGTSPLNLGTGNVTLGGNRALTIGGTLTVGGAIGGAFGLTKGGGGTLVLSGQSSYSGATNINQGILSVNSLADYGSNSALGAPTSGSIRLGGGTLNGTLLYTGAGNSSNRTFQIGDTTAANTGSGAISNNGTGALILTAPTFNPTITGITTPRLLTLGGTATGVVNEIQGVIQDNNGATGRVDLAKSDAGTWALSGVNTYTGPTTINAGTLKVTGSIAQSAGVTVGNGGTFLAAPAGTAPAVMNLNALTVGTTPTDVAKAKITGAAIASAILVTLTLSLTGAGAQLDLDKQVLFLTYDNTPADAKATNNAAIRALITAGRGDGTWNGATGITSSAILAAAAHNDYAVGYLDTGDMPGMTTYLGQSVNDHTIIARYTIKGDSNLDGKVDFTDLVAVAQHYNQSIAGGNDVTWRTGDFDYDGIVNFADLVAVAQHYNQTAAGDPVPGASAEFNADWARAVSLVPEPGALSLLAVGALVLMRRKRPAA